MKISVLTVLAASSAVVFATGDVTPTAEPGIVKPVAAEECKPLETPVLPQKSLFEQINPEAVRHEPVTVPEPVWASVLAACALSLLRRGRSY
ncbi:MAG TPA: hypothetical protein VHM91_23495 [Verrucomicrobiales bacterium]|jgi:hypothetical protein|nr:hypothetical protein [Verrucomicrobiales bacterium]